MKLTIVLADAAQGDRFLSELLAACRQCKCDATMTQKIMSCCKRIKQGYKDAPWSNGGDNEWPLFIEQVIDCLSSKGPKAALALCSKQLREVTARVIAADSPGTLTKQFLKSANLDVSAADKLNAKEVAQFERGLATLSDDLQVDLGDGTRLGLKAAREAGIDSKILQKLGIG